eukprot:GHVR01032540.1.p1 GENE.GHVR01032540.1~~GHVR01032540.1.p1  ORF type:complete len:211 (+),score=24.74 GHVR01032540.1:639-1271(+)
MVILVQLWVSATSNTHQNPAISESQSVSDIDDDSDFSLPDRDDLVSDGGGQYSEMQKKQQMADDSVITETPNLKSLPGAPGLPVQPSGFNPVTAVAAQKPAAQAGGKATQQSISNRDVNSAVEKKGKSKLGNNAKSIAPLFALVPMLMMMPLLISFAQFSSMGFMPSMVTPNFMMANLMSGIGIGALAIPLDINVSLPNMQANLARLVGS